MTPGDVGRGNDGVDARRGVPAGPPQKESGVRPSGPGLRPRYVRRVTPAHVGSRVSVRSWTDTPTDGQRTTDVVGRLLVFDDTVMLIVGRDGQLRGIDPARVLASRVIPAHPRLAPEPAGGTEDEPLVREAARVLLLDPTQRVLLIAHEPDSGRLVWTAPGGGREPHEDHATAARREIAEEIGIDVTLGPLIWHRRVVFAYRGVWIDQDERWFLARTGPLDTATVPLDDLGALHAQWWSLDDLRTTTDQLAPQSLPEHLARLLADGPPDQPVDVGY